MTAIATTRRQALTALGTTAAAAMAGTSLPAWALSTPNATGNIAAGAAPWVGLQLEGGALGRDETSYVVLQAGTQETVWVGSSSDVKRALYAVTVTPADAPSQWLVQVRPHTLEAGACGAAVCNAFDTVVRDGQAQRVSVSVNGVARPMGVTARVLG